MRSKYEQPMIDILTRIRQQQHQYDHQLNAIYGMLNHYKTYDELMTHLKEYMAAIEGSDPCYSLFTQLEDPLLVGFLKKDLVPKMMADRRKGNYFEVLFLVV